MAAGSDEKAYEAQRIGMDLRAARERLGLDLHAVAARLRVRPAYLEALEAGALEQLPPKPYALGYLRGYAKVVGLDPDKAAQRLKPCLEPVALRPPPLEFPAPLPERGVPVGATLLVASLLMAGAYIAWYRLSAEGSLPAEGVQRVPARLAPLAEQAPPAPAPAPPPAPAAASPAASPGPALPDLPQVPPSSAAAAMPVPPTAPDSRIVLRATADSWMQVRERGGGPVLLSRVLKAGESWAVPSAANLVLTVGNAGGTELVIDGVVAPGIGGPGVVRRDLPLDPDQIKDGRLPAQVQAASGLAAAPAQPASTRTNPAP